MDISVCRRIQPGIRQFVFVCLQLHSKLSESGRCLFIIIGRNTFLLEQFSRSCHFVFQLVILYLQSFHSKQIIRIIKFGK